MLELKTDYYNNINNLCEYISQNKENIDISEIIIRNLNKSVIIIDKYFQIIKQSLINESHSEIYNLYIRKKANNSFSKIIYKNKNYFIFVFPIYLKNKNDYYLLLVISDKELLPNEKDLIYQASIILSFELLKQKSLIEIERKVKLDLSEEILFNNNVKNNELLRKAAYLNYNLKAPNVIIIIERDNLYSIKDKLDEDRVNTILIKIIEKYLKMFFQEQFLVTERDDGILILISFFKRNCNCKDLLDPMIMEIKREALALIPVTISIGISNICNEIVEIKKNYNIIKNGLILNKCLGKNSFIIHQSQIGMNELFFDLFNQNKFCEFSKQFLEPLLKYEKGEQALLKTADIYLTVLNLQQSAQLLFTHVNTIRYRINKIEELLKMSFKSEEDRFKLRLALNINQFIK